MVASTWIGVQCHQSLGKHKLKPQWILLTLTRIVKIKIINNTKCWWGYGEINYHALQWECKMTQPLQKANLAVS